MADESKSNESRYKAGFKPEKKELVKTTPLRFVPGFSAEKQASLGFKTESHPTPRNSSVFK